MILARYLGMYGVEAIPEFSFYIPQNDALIQETSGDSYTSKLLTIWPIVSNAIRQTWRRKQYLMCYKRTIRDQ